jgi:hypothetical protein
MIYNRQGLVKKGIVALLSATLSFGLASCSSAKSSGGVKLACAGVENYQTKTALAMVDAASGGSAVDTIDTIIGGQKEIIGTESIATSIFDSYFGAMKQWASAVDISQVFHQKEKLAEARTQLEGAIDTLAPKCEANGWRFEKGWRG